MKKKSVALLLALVLVFGAAVGGTIAYLMDATEAITNTFTVGNVDIDLDETTGTEYKMTPGATIDKDPFVTVKEGSEICWVFVKVEKSEGLDNYIEYAMDDAWKEVPGETNVFYQENCTPGNYPVLKGEEKQITVKTTVTNEMMDTANDNPPTLTFTAYAVQSANVTAVADAWAAAQTASVYGE